MNEEDLIARGTALILGTAAPYSAEIAAALLAEVRAGHSILHACRTVKINRATLYAWLKKDPALQDKLTRARVESVTNLTEIWLTELDNIVDLAANGAAKNTIRAHSIRADHLRRYIATVSKNLPAAAPTLP